MSEMIWSGEAQELLLRQPKKNQQAIKERAEAVESTRASDEGRMPSVTEDIVEYAIWRLQDEGAIKSKKGQKV